MKIKILISVFISSLLILAYGLSISAVSYLDAQGMESKRIHFINVGNGDAILLENNGHFAMIDVGEDTDYPDGSDPRYPFRPGITINEGYEEKVINYLKNVGVKKLDFIIGTHAHSDHIGSMPNVMDKFKTDKLYAKVYSDKYISNTDRLWDNQYVYDRMIEAANRNSVEIIQDFNEKNTKFQFYDMNVEILNWENKLNSDGTRKLLSDENEEALGVKISYGKEKIFLASDIQNIDGDEDRLVPIIGKVDFLKIGHHGLGNETSKNFIKKLKPNQAVNSGIFDCISPYKLEALAEVGATLFITESFEDAVVIEISANNIKVINDKQFQYNTSESNWYYYENGVKVKNAFKDIYYRFNYERYYFENTGKAVKGFFDVNKKRYYAGDNYVIKRGWTKINDDWYYMDNTGEIQKGLIKVDNKSYYLDDNGIMQTGLLKINGDYYYFDLNNGDMQKGVCNLDDGIYYFNIDNGKRESGWIKFNDNLYYCDSKDYKAKVGWFSIDEKDYYAGEDGALKTGIQTIDGKQYYFNKETGELELGFVEDNNKIYYFETAGVLKKGWFMLDDNWYYADCAGAIKTHWLYLNNNWYYMDSLGKMKTGWLWDNAWYYFDSSGKMKTGWLWDNAWYYFDDNGKMKTGWLWDNAWYYFDSDGKMAKNTFIGEYFIDANGRLI